MDIADNHGVIRENVTSAINMYTASLSFVAPEAAEVTKLNIDEYLSMQVAC